MSETRIFYLFIFFCLKRVITSINQPRSINITDALADEVNKKDEDTKEFGGIDIEEAKRLLRNEDQYDKQLYRERIKRVHREKRLKEKEVRRAKRAKNTDPGAEADLDMGVNVTLATGDENDQNDDYNEDSDDGDE